MASKNGPSRNKSIFDGVVNPSGFFIASFVPLFAAGIPLTSYLTKPNGIVQSLVQASFQLLPGATNLPRDRSIPALAFIYIFAVIPFTGALSVSGQAAATDRGLDNNEPRKHQNSLTGMPLRLRSAHLNLIENFGIWAVAAGLAQVIAPNNQQVINLLGLAALSKIFVYWPAYVFNIAPLRSICHLIHTGAVLNAALRIATEA